MAAALLRGTTGLCARCVHRQLCRVVWRPQVALFSSKPSDRRQPRRTHIKKAKPQPAMDIAKLLEQLFSQRRPGAAPPAARPTKPPATFSMKVSTSNVPPLSKTEPAVSVFAAASSVKQPDSILKTTFNTAPPPPQTKVELKTVTAPPLSAHMVETNKETSSFSASTVETIIETTEPPVEPGLSSMQTLEEVGEGSVEPALDALQTKNTDSGVVAISHTTKEEPSAETTIDAPVEAMETPQSRAAAVEVTVEATTDASVAKTKSSGVVDISHTSTVEPLIETTLESSSASLETLESRSETTIETEAAQTTGLVNISYGAKDEPLIETTVDSSVEAMETVESRAAVAEGLVEVAVDAPTDASAQAVQISSTDSGHVNSSHIAEEEPLVETTVEASVESSMSPLETVDSRAASEGAVEAASNKHARECAPLPLKQEVGSSSGNVVQEEEANKHEQMTLESVTLHEVQVQVEALKTKELLQTKSALDEEAEKQVQELLVQTGTGAEPEGPTEHESETLTEALTKWDSLSEELQQLDRESGTLVKELLCQVPAVLSKASTSTPPVGMNGERLPMEEKGTEAEAMTLESITLARVTAEVGGLETEVLLETRNALEKKAEVLAKERMEVQTAAEDVASFEDTAEAEIVMLDSIAEATDAIEAETSVMLEAMLGSEQGPRRPPDALLIDQRLRQQDETTDQEAEQEGTVLQAMTLESVTLAEVEASLGSLESLSETTEHLEKEADVLAGEKRMQVEFDETPPEALKIESLTLLDGDALSEVLQTDTLMEELLFSVPGHVKGRQSGQEVEGANISDAVDIGSVDVDSVAAVTDDIPASPAVEEVMLGQDVEEEEGVHTEALANEKDLDPVQRLFLEKIREYNNMRRLNGGPLEAEPYYQKYLSEEAAKLQRLYGGGDLSSFPEFTFSEPKMDQDSK